MGDFTQLIGPALSVGGTLLSANAQVDKGVSSNASYQFRAQQLDQLSGQQEAASQRVAIDDARKAKLLGSRAQAVAAASGAGADTRTVTDIISNIAKEGSYRSSLALYQGSSDAQQTRLRAAGERFSGNAAVSAGQTAGFATLLSGASSLFSKYGKFGLPSSSGADFSKGASYGTEGKVGGFDSGSFDIPYAAFG